MSIRLVKPTADYAEEIMSYRTEFLDNGEIIHGGSMLEMYDSADDGLLILRSFQTTAPRGLFPRIRFLR